MIKILIVRNEIEQNTTYTMSGHAMYAKAGHDIVCAAVSSVCQAAYLGLTQVLKYEISVYKKDGYFNFKVPQAVLSDDKAKAITDTMVLALKNMEISYGKYMRVETKEVR